MADHPVSFLERFSTGETSTLAEESQGMLDKIYKSKRAAASFYPLFLARNHVPRHADDEAAEA
jgi:hypothetical protein